MLCRVGRGAEAVALLDAMKTGHAAVTWLSTVGIGSIRVR
jgi:Flp pilus assembly CpaF family ATPase